MTQKTRLGKLLAVRKDLDLRIRYVHQQLGEGGFNPLGLTLTLCNLNTRAQAVENRIAFLARKS